MSVEANCLRWRAALLVKSTAVLSAIGAALLSFTLNTADAASAGSRSLLREARAELPSWLEQSPDLQVRSTTAHFDVDQLRSIAEMPAEESSTQIFELKLFTDTAYSVQVRKIERFSPTRFTIYGTIRGAREDSNGHAIISVVDGVAQASVTSPEGRVFQITHAGEFYQVSQVDPRRIPRCGAGDALSKKHHLSASSATAEAETISSSEDRGEGELSASATTVIDVMIVYTPAMLAKAGSVRAMEAMCQAAVGATDQAFHDSGVNARVRLVHTDLIAYQESGGLNTDLARARITGDGHMDEIAELRNRYAADVVSVFVSSSTDGYAGMAYISVDKNRVAPEMAYNVCVGIYGAGVFRHEFGHNLGCGHARSGSGADPAQAFSYSYGYSFTGNDGVTYGDIMASGTSNRFSNPKILFQGVPTGVSKSAANSADNAATINATAPIVANYRHPLVPNAPVYSFHPPLGGTMFPAAEVGIIRASKDAYISNSGSAPLAISNFGFKSGGSDFRVKVFLSSARPYGGANWPAVADPRAFVVDPGGYAMIVLNCAPSKYGEISGILSFEANDPKLGGQPQLLTLTAAGGSPHLKNISTRLQVGTGDNVLIGGFIVGGSAPRKVMIRAVGPSLRSNGIAGALADPTLEVFQGETLIASNDDWGSGLSRETIRQSGLAPLNDLESAMILTLDPGSYTTIVRGLENATGVALVEAYVLDADGASEVLNISTRGEVGRGDNVMIGGFIVGDDYPSRVLIRAIGPSLSSAGISRPLLDPVLEVYGADGALLLSNDNWRATQEREIAKSSLPPADDREAAIVATLPPGSYTAIVRGANDVTGVALVEVYKLTPENEAAVLASQLNLDTLFPNLTTDGSRNSPHGYAVGRILADDPNDLYWFETESARAPFGGLIKRVSKTGGATTVLATGLAAVNGFAADAGSVYWTEVLPGGAALVRKLAKNGSGITDLASGTPPSPPGLATYNVRDAGTLCIDAEFVYWIDQNQWGFGLVRKISKSGGEVTTLYLGYIERFSLECDDQSVYFLTGRNLYRVAKTGGDATVVAANAYAEGSAYLSPTLPIMALSHDFFTVLDRTGAITSIPRSGGAPVSLGKAITPHNLAVDATYAYYQSRGGIYRVPVAGGGVTVVSPYTALGSNAFNVSLDSGNVYYSNVGPVPASGAILSFAK